MREEVPSFKGLIDGDEEWRDAILATGGLCVPSGVPLTATGGIPPFTWPAEVTFAPRKVYGLAEVAALTGRKRKKLRRWIAKGTLPAPSERLSTGPVWLAEDIEPWLRKYLTPTRPVRDSLARFSVQRQAIQYPAPPSLRGEAP
jgi:predicted DNA-binding transcriptional regulator AlpA